MKLTVGQALVEARAFGLARLDAQLLLGRQLGRPRTWLLAHDDAVLEPLAFQAFITNCDRRAQGVPLAYLTGEREFHGLTLAVSPAVLVPRPDTETLVDWALELLQCQPHTATPHVLDLGTGSGAIALAIKRAWPGAQVLATDASAAALEVAQANAQRLGLTITFRLGSWWQAVAGEAFDLVLSNPPYVAEADPHLEALRHEPRQALVSGPAGLDDLKLIIAGAGLHLRGQGRLLVEHGAGQAAAVVGLMAEAGLAAVGTRRDLAGLDRCSGAQRATGARHSSDAPAPHPPIKRGHSARGIGGIFNANLLSTLPCCGIG